MDKFTQLQSLMMGYEHSALNWNKDLKLWTFLFTEEEHGTMLVDFDLDNLIDVLLNSDL